MVLLSFLLACTSPDVEGGRLRINEVMSANDSAVKDPANPECPEFDDWVELVNVGSAPVDLDGITLWANADTFPLTGTLGVDEHLLIWADDDVEQGPDHAPFQIAAAGERLMLSRAGRILDTVDVPADLPRDHSWARVRDGAETWSSTKVSTPGEPNHRVLPDDPCFAPRPGFDDHSYPCMSTEAGFVALAGPRTQLQVVKFDIFAFGEPARRRMAYVDTAFYTLHDQFYLFRIFNGQPFEGIDDHEPYDGSFATFGELDDWARSVDLDLLVPADMATFAGDRLISRTFYDHVFRKPRHLGVGTIIRQEREGEAPFWGFELEYGDEISYDDLVIYFETLEATGPPEFRELKWLIRSPFQESLAQQIEAEGGPYADRMARYGELAVDGEVEVYQPGLTAGRVVRIRAGEPGLDDTRSSDILVLDEIPDELPPCAALITSVPQTALSHISLLARSRGIPNLYVAGITDDAEWDAWHRRGAYIALDAAEDGTVRATDIGADSYGLWTALGADTVPELEEVDPESLPWAYDLATAPDMLALRSEVGGKAAGMRQLLLEPTLDPPDTPLGLTTRAYHRHLQAFPWLPDLLDAAPFVDSNDAVERYLVLEGREAFDERFPAPGDQSTADRFVADHVAETVGELAAGTGLRGRIAATPMPVEAETALLDEVEAQFGWLAPSQGLRVRSSSTVEDIEGFNGAGLYTSVTGYRDGSGRSVDEAIREVWASYWGAEAYEERDGVGIDHLAGGMGLLVHPRFDDDRELSNAVFTASRLPDGSLEVQINTQEGAVSVANPPTTCPPVLPESLLVHDRTGEVVVERLGASSEVPAGVHVLDDSQAIALFDVAGAVVDAWLAVENEVLPETQRRSVLTLDLESREMAAGWPEGSQAGDRLVVKQARSLEPSAAGLPEDIQELPAPRDLLARAASVQLLVCDGGDVVWLHTDPRLLPDMGYSEVPFVVEALGVDHQGLDDVIIDDDTVEVTLEGERTVLTDCVAQTLWASPDLFLLGFL